MKAKEFIIELKKESKPRNFVAKNAKMGGAGQHKDKKKAEKQGDVKHKTKQYAEDAVADFLARGGQIQQGKFRKPRKSEKTDYGSRHIGGMRDAIAGKAGKTLGRAAATNFKGGGKAVVGENNIVERDREDDEGWGSMNKSEFKRRELQHELGHEKNNLQISINGRPWKVFPGRGYADSQEERSYLRSMQSWAEKKSAATGKKWTVSLTGLDPS